MTVLVESRGEAVLEGFGRDGNGSVRVCLAGHGSRGPARSGTVWLGQAGHGSLGQACCGVVWQRMALRGLAVRGRHVKSRPGAERCDMVRQSRIVMVRPVAVFHGTDWSGSQG